MKKNRTANAVMILAVALIAAAAVLFVIFNKGSTVGDAVPAVTSDTVGTVTTGEKEETERPETEKPESADSSGEESEDGAQDADHQQMSEPVREDAPAEESARDTQRQETAATAAEETKRSAATGAAPDTAKNEPHTETAGETAGTTDDRIYCTITIRCDTVKENMDLLDPAKAPYVPADGFILHTVSEEYTEGDTVFDVLKRACDGYGIQIEYSWTPIYDSYYIEGIGYLYEFDCGDESGWTYTVDGAFPNYGCSEYILSGGEDIVWYYSCRGYGADVGGGKW